MLYPQLTTTRNVYSLDGIWNFKQGEYTPGVDHPLTAKEVMAVPSSFNDLTVSQEKRNFVGDVWYERVVSVPPVASDEELVLRFGSVTHTASVYVDGELVGSHRGGFTPFEVVIDPAVAQKGQFLLTVCANNVLDHTTLPVGNYSEEVLPDGTVKKDVIENFDFFNYAGIQRPVRLYTRPVAHIEDIVITATVLEADATLHVAVQTTNDALEKRVTVLDEEGTVVATSKMSDVTIADVRLWNVMDSYLYTVRVELLDGDRVVDSYDEPYGVRTVRVADGKFYINDKPVYFKGFGKHEDSYVNGRGFNEALNVMDLNLMKKIGANSFRTSHYPYSEEMMRLADRMGFMVIDEVPAVGLFANFTAALNMDAKVKPLLTWEYLQTKDAHEQVLHELVERDKNHACVVLWSVANEPDGSGVGADKYFAPLIQLVKDIDPQHRPATVVNIGVSGYATDLVTPYVDVICLNRYFGWYSEHGDLAKARVALTNELLAWQEKYPDKPIIMTEYGADTITGYHSNWDTPYTEEYQEKFHDMYHEVFDTIENFVGEQVWNFADFETNARTIIRVKGNHKGLFTRTREPKAAVKQFIKRWKGEENCE